MTNSRCLSVRVQTIVASCLVVSLLCSYIPPVFAQEAVDAPADSGSVGDIGGQFDTGSTAEPVGEAPSPVFDLNADPIVTPGMPEIPEPEIPSILEPEITPQEAEVTPEDPKAEAMPEEKGVPEEEEPQMNSLISTSGGESTGVGDPNSGSSGAKVRPDVDQTTGALTFSYPFFLPPGRNGLTPQLALNYNSQDMNRAENIVGPGWSLSIPSISLSLKAGTTSTYAPAPYISSLSGELVLKGDGSYGARVEQGDFIRYSYSTSTWIATTKMGTQYTFGDVDSARQRSGNRIAKWMLTEVRDANGNSINYAYENDAQQVYPSTITYTNYYATSSPTLGPFQINFTKQTRPDALTSYKNGFLVTTNSRISKIDALVNGVIQRSYTLGYVVGDNATSSLLATITESGVDESSNTITLPSTTSTYQTHTKSWTKNTDVSKWQNPFAGPGSMQGVQYLDVNGDALVDAVASKYNAGSCASMPPPSPPYSYYTFLNTGTGWSQASSSWDLPMPLLNCDNKDLGTRLADVNNDGLVDVVYFGPQKYSGDPSGSGSLFQYVFINNGSGWTWDQTWSFPLPIISPSYASQANPLGDNGIRIVDINNDGLVDIIQSLPNAGNPNLGVPRIFLHTGHGWSESAASWNVPFPFVPAMSSNGQYIQNHTTVFSDINGDGLTDLLEEQINIDGNGYGTAQASRIFIHTGSGWVLDSSISIPLPITRGAFNSVGGGPWITTQTEVADINGDSLPDLVNTKATRTDGTHQSLAVVSLPQPYDDYPTMPGDTATSTVYLNTGRGWSLVNWTVPRLFLMPSYANDGAWVWPTNSFIDRGAQLMDVDGDGSSDLVFTSWDGNNHDSGGPTYLGNRGMADSIQSLTTPLGGRTDVAYRGTAELRKGDGSLFNPSFPLNLSVVQSKTLDDSKGVQVTSTYQYEDGFLYSSSTAPVERKIAGFAKVSETTASSTVRNSYFLQGKVSNPNTSIGAYQDSFEKIGVPYRAETKDISGNLFETTINRYSSTDIGDTRKFVSLSQSLESTYDGDASHKDKAVAYSYDSANGNQTQKVEYGEVNGSDDGTFSDTGTDKFTTNISYAANATSSVIGSAKQVTVLDYGSTQVKDTKYTYDGLVFGNIDKGNRTKEENWKVSSTYVSSTNGYNSYGMVTTSTDPRGKVTTYGYDSFNLYVATTTNPLGQKTRALYDYTLGKPKRITDPNGLITQTTYDGLDRVTQLWVPDLTTSSTQVLNKSFGYIDTPGAISVTSSVFLAATSTASSFAYYDGFGRLIQSRGASTSTNLLIAKDIVYDNRGLISRESLPYFSSGTARTAATTTAALLTSYTYDPAQRVKTATNILGNTTTTYADWRTAITDPNGEIKDLYYDAYRRLVQVDEHNLSSTHTTAYQYDGNNGLKKITDASGNVRNFTYDGLGRRTAAEDLHAVADGTYGSWSYTYDDAGNMTTVVDPKSQTINYTYDDVNRPLTEDYTGQAGTEVTYAYDSCIYGIGLLCTASSTVTKITNKYTPRQWLGTETDWIGGVNYHTTTTYDRVGNQLTITNPDGSQIKYEYAGDRFVKKVFKKETTDANHVLVVSSIDYAPNDQMSRVTYANGVTTVNTYDPTKLYRMTRKVSTLPNASKAQDITYTYDAVGNITQLVEAGATNTRRTVNYGYDDLHRLTSAVATGTPVGISGYNQTFSYDALGNILTSDQGAYGYTGHTGSLYANPHAATTIGSQSLTYDRNGNVTAVASSTLGWLVNSGIWQKRKAITIDETKVPGSTAFTDFPVLISATDPELRTISFGGSVVSASGTDIFFTSSNGTTKLNHEIESYTSSTGAITAWVKVPSLAAVSNTTLYMYYGNTSSTNQQNVAGTWDSNARAVWHFSDHILDSTSNANTSTNYGTTSSTGKIAGARSSNGSQRLTALNKPSLKPTNQITVSAWVKRPDAEPDWGPIVYFGTVSSTPYGPYSLQMNGTNDEATMFHLASTTTDYGINASATGTVATSTWTLLTGTHSGTSMKYYVNGVLQSTWNTTFNLGNYDSIYGLGIMGSMNYNGWKGDIDEVRVLGTARSGDWILTEYNNQNSTSTFYSIGSTQTSSTGVYTTSSVYTWDYLNRMTQATGNGATSTYAYNPSNQRITSTVTTSTGSVTTRYPTKFYNITNGIPTKHIFANGAMVATIIGSGSTSTVSYILTDHLSGSNVVTNASGTITELSDYMPFGAVRLDDKISFDQKKKFGGHDFDDETRLSYMGARYYNGTNGRFISEDPSFLDLSFNLVDPQSFNSYAYAQNNPLRNTDPDGRGIADAVLGAVNAWASNNAFGAGRISPDDYNGPSQNDYKAGQAVGDFVSMFTGVAETVVASGASGASTVGGFALAIPTGGASLVVSGGVNVVAAGVAAHGVTTAASGAYNFSQAIRNGGAGNNYNWRDLSRLQRHFTDHGADFGARNAQDYARKANQFYKKFGKEGVDIKIDSNGDVRMYEAKTNTFGVYDKNGMTRSFFKPDPTQNGGRSGLQYFEDQGGVRLLGSGGSP